MGRLEQTTRPPEQAKQPEPTTAPGQNPDDRFDVNNDGRVSAIDALLIINQFNAHGYSIPNDAKFFKEKNYYPDVDGDGVLSPNDVLEVINTINATQTTDKPKQTHSASARPKPSTK